MPVTSKTNLGYVYVLSNPSMPGLVKIGRSINGGKARAKNLYQTGTPTPFVLEFEILVDDCCEIEQLAHEGLDAFRLANSREFFQVSADEAALAIMKAFLLQSDIVVCSADEIEAVSGAISVGNEAGMMCIDACYAVGWVRSEDLLEAHTRRMAERMIVRKAEASHAES